MSDSQAINLQRAAQLLCNGRLVAFPTETVYGLGANALAAEAVARIFAAKGRPTFNPLIVHIADARMAERFCDVSRSARVLMDAFWPGPLTLVLPRKTNCAVCDLVSAGGDTLALRIPGHPIARELLRLADIPVAAPSANRSGHVSATAAAHVRHDLGERVDMIIDGGPTRLGLESTVVKICESERDGAGAAIRLLRPGAVTADQMENVVGCAVDRAAPVVSSHPSSPGQLESHYAPAASVRLNAGSVHAGEALLAFGTPVPEHDGPCVNLSRAGDLVEAAAKLFGALRELDATGVSSIAAMPVPNSGLGEAINDRLRRAAAPRAG